MSRRSSAISLRWTSPSIARTPAGSRSSPAACSAARARSSSAGCGARRSRSGRSRSSSRRSTTATATTTSSRTARCASPRTTCRRRASCSTRCCADTEVVGIDEGQFFDAELPAVCNTLADQGKRVIVAGLDQDYLGKPFEPMPQLLAIAEYITKTLAICMVCGVARQPHAAARGQQRARPRRRAGDLRGALPALLRSRRSGSRYDMAASGHAPDSAASADRARHRLLRRQPPPVRSSSSVSRACAGRRCSSGPGARPPFYRLLLALGAVLSLAHPLQAAGARQMHLVDVFGETMMLMYYAYARPAQPARSAAASTRTASGPTAGSSRTRGSAG